MVTASDIPCPITLPNSDCAYYHRKYPEDNVGDGLSGRL